MTLNKLQRRQLAKITGLPDNFQASVQLLEQGFYLEAKISLAHQAPFNGPLAFNLHGTKVSIQKSLAEQIVVELY